MMNIYSKLPDFCDTNNFSIFLMFCHCRCSTCISSKLRRFSVSPTRVKSTRKPLKCYPTNKQGRINFFRFHLSTWFPLEPLKTHRQRCKVTQVFRVICKTQAMVDFLNLCCLHLSLCSNFSNLVKTLLCVYVMCFRLIPIFVHSTFLLFAKSS